MIEIPKKNFVCGLSLLNTLNVECTDTLLIHGIVTADNRLALWLTISVLRAKIALRGRPRGRQGQVTRFVEVQRRATFI